MYVRYSDALKQFRRMAHVHQGAWKCAVVCKNDMLDVAFKECVATMKGTSHASGMQTDYSKRVIELANGATIRFTVANSMGDIDMRLKGLSITHIICLGTQHLVNYTTPNMRSDIVPPEDFVINLVEGI